MHDRSVFLRYKSLRNAIRKLSLLDSLNVIHGYIQNLQFGSPIPSDCEVHREYTAGDTKGWITEFYLELLCREIILHAVEEGESERSLKDWNTLRGAIIKLQCLEDFIAGKFGASDLFMRELLRIAHRQFPWATSKPTAANITRYFVIYKHAALADVIERSTGLIVKELFVMGMALLGKFFNNFAMTYPVNVLISGLSNESLNRFLDHFSTELGVLRQALATEQQINERFSYAYHSLRSYPIIKAKCGREDGLICPIPTLLFGRFTSGVYYTICNETRFDNAYGEAFQSYIGEVLKRGTTEQKTTLYPEREYRVGHNLKRTVDWIMDQEAAALFIEAKTKRMRADAKAEIVTQEVLQEELTKMAAMVVQVYKSIADYRNGHYPNFPFSERRKIFPVVVTLEDWFLMGPRIRKFLDVNVKQGLETAGIPSNWLEEMPYTVCSAQELEQAIQVMDQLGIETVMKPKVFSERLDWTLMAHLQNSFSHIMATTRFLFIHEFQGLNIKPPRA